MFDLINRLLDCALKPDAWPTALDEFVSVFEVKSVHIAAVDSDQSKRRPLICSGFLRTGPGGSVREYYERGSGDGDKAAFQRTFSLPPNQLICERDLFGVSDNSELPPSTLRDKLAQVGVHSRIGALLNATGPWADVLTIHTENGTQEADILRHPQISAILQIVAKTIEIQRVFDSLRERYRAALTVLDRLGLGVILANHHGAKILSNTEAERITELSDGITVGQDGHLRVPGQTNSKFQNVIQRALSPKPEFSTITLRRRSGNHDFIVSVGPLTDAGGELDPNLHCALILIIDPSRPRPLRVDNIAALGALTNSEAHVTEYLVRGLRFDEIAERRGVQVSTIRAQFKSISRKLRCNSQADVIRLAASTDLPFVND